MSSRRGKRWTAREVTRAIQLRKARWTIEDIAEDMGRSVDAVRVKLSKVSTAAKYPKRPRGRLPVIEAHSSVDMARVLQVRGWTVRPPGWLAEYVAMAAAYESACPDGAGATCETPLPLPPPPNRDGACGVHLW